MSKYLPRFEKFSVITSLNKLSASTLSETSTMCRLFLLMLSYISFNYFSLSFSFFFSFCSSDWMNSTDLSSSSLNLSSAWLILLLKLSFEFYISVIAVFNARISALKRISISLLISHFVHALFS